MAVQFNSKEMKTFVGIYKQAIGVMKIADTDRCTYLQKNLFIK